MKILIYLLFIITTFISCKDDTKEEKLPKYYLLIDAVEKNANGITEVNKVDSVYCINDKMAIAEGIKNYYNEVIRIEKYKQGGQAQMPYIISAKGWAVLNQLGESVKEKVPTDYIDSVDQSNLARANDSILNSTIQ